MDFPILAPKLVRSAIGLLFAAAVAAGCSSAPAPKDVKFELLTQKGKTTSLSDYKGKVVLLDFWATWCGPCHETAPLVDKIGKDYESQGLVTIGVTNEARGTVEKFAASRTQSYALALDLDNSVNAAFQVVGYPTVVVIGRDGSVVFTGHPKETKELRAAIVGALAKS